MAKGDDRQRDNENLREIAEKVRDLARQTWIAEARGELFDLADRLDRMAEAVTRYGQPRRRGSGET
jgi:hypothetical protein